MDTNADRAMKYRQRAEHIRVTVDEMSSPNSQEPMLKLAADYERLAAVLTGLTTLGISN